MKKIFIVASVLLMCCMFMGCGVKAKLDGTWKSNNVYTSEYDDYTRTDTYDSTLTINKDGTFALETVYSRRYNSEVSKGYPKTEKSSGTWYYHDSDKVILKRTNYSEQEGDEVPEVDDEVGYMSAELLLVDDILFVDYGSEIFEFTKAE